MTPPFNVEWDDSSASGNRDEVVVDEKRDLEEALRHAMEIATYAGYARVCTVQGGLIALITMFQSKATLTEGAACPDLLAPIAARVCDALSVDLKIIPAPSQRMATTSSEG